MTYRQLVAEIKKGHISPFYLFEGKEDYLKNQALLTLKEQLVAGNEDFNFQRVNATRYTAREVLELACQLPFNSTWQVLVVDEVERLTTKDEKVIKDYLKKPVPSTCMVLMGGKLDSRSALYKFCKEEGKLVHFYPLDERRAVQWLKDKAKGQGKSITDEAAFELYRRTGGDLFLLGSELDKLVSFIYPRASIQTSHVIELAGEKVQENIFDFLRAFKQKNLPLSLHILNRLFLRSEEPLIVNSMLTREVRILFSLKLAEPKMTPDRACSYIFKGKKGHSSFYLQRATEYIKATENFTIPQLLFAQQRILKTEFSIKKGREEPKIALQKTLIDILSY